MLSLSKPLLFAFLLGLGACASTPETRTPDDAPSVPTGPLAPLPYTSGELRDAMPVGTSMRFKMESQGETTFEEWVVTAADTETCTIASKVFDAAGALVEDQGAEAAKWDDLRDHAAFPAAMTERSDSHVDGPAGSFDTWRYVVSGPGPDGKPMTSTFEFAKGLPGPPVSMVVEADGQTVVRMTLVERK